MSKLGALVFAAMFMVPVAAFAYTQEDANACTPDAFRLCASAIPDVSRVAHCLYQNKQQLSSPCTAVFNRLRDTRERQQVQKTNY